MEKDEEYYCSIPARSDEDTNVDDTSACFQRASDKLAGTKRPKPEGGKD
jgi:hypothetical protein